MKNLPTKTITKSKSKIATIYLLAVALVAVPLTVGLYISMFAMTISGVSGRNFRMAVSYYNDNSNNTNTTNTNTNNNTNMNTNTNTNTSYGTTQSFIRGDANRDGVVDIGDILTIGMAIDQIRPEYIPGNMDLISPCFAAADANGDDIVSIEDVFYLINFLFGGGPPPPSPFPNLGTDPYPGILDCKNY